MRRVSSGISTATLVPDRNVAAEELKAVNTLLAALTPFFHMDKSLLLSSLVMFLEVASYDRRVLLAGRPNRMGITKLSQKVGVAVATGSRLVTNLEGQLELLDVFSDPDNYRAKCPTLSLKGKEMVAQLNRAISKPAAQSTVGHSEVP